MAGPARHKEDDVALMYQCPECGGVDAVAKATELLCKRCEVRMQLWSRVQE